MSNLEVIFLISVIGILILVPIAILLRNVSVTCKKLLGQIKDIVKKIGAKIDEM